MAKLLRTTIVGFALAAILAQAALAWGEPKNEYPFTRSTGSRATQSATAGAAAAVPAVRGEPKNEAPFTRPTTIVVAASSGGFNWADGAIGSVAGVGLALSAAGVLVATRRVPRAA